MQIDAQTVAAEKEVQANLPYSTSSIDNGLQTAAVPRGEYSSHFRLRFPMDSVSQDVVENKEEAPSFFRLKLSMNNKR